MPEWFPIAVGIVGTAVVSLIAIVVVWDMLVGKIDLSKLLADNQDASLSRFQFLVFTFVIGFSYLLLVVCHVCKDATTELPGVPGGALALIGISAGGYVLGKGIQKAADTSTTNAAANANARINAPPSPPPVVVTTG